MKDYGEVRGTVKPQKNFIDENSVWVNSEIEIITENKGKDNEFIGFKWNMKQYPKDEYIKMIDDKNTNLVEQMTNTQVALCEVYELVGV